MKECGILGVKTYSDLICLFQGSEPLQTPWSTPLDESPLGERGSGCKIPFSTATKFNTIIYLMAGCVHRGQCARGYPLWAIFFPLSENKFTTSAPVQRILRRQSAQTTSHNPETNHAVSRVSDTNRPRLWSRHGQQQQLPCISLCKRSVTCSRWATLRSLEAFAALVNGRLTRERERERERERILFATALQAYQKGYEPI